MEPVAFKADSFDSVVTQVSRFWRSKVVVPRERGPFRYEMTALWSQSLSIGMVHCGVGRTSRASVAQPMLQVPINCSADFRIGRTKVAVGPGEAVLLPPGHEYTARISAGSVLFLQVDAAVLVSSLRAGRAGRPRHWVTRCVQIDVSQNREAELLTEVESLLQKRDVLSSVGPSAEFRDLEPRIAAWLTGALLDRGGLQTSIPAATELAERADEFIESNFSDPITLETLAAQFGVTARWLQRCCMAHWGVPPMERVKSRRLALARSCLLSPDAPSVTSVAVRCGFNHLGRFADLYSRTYGELPSETLGAAERLRQLLVAAQSAQSMEKPADVKPAYECSAVPWPRRRTCSEIAGPSGR